MRAYLAHGYDQAADATAAEREAAETMKILLEVAPEEKQLIAVVALYRGTVLAELHREDEARPFLEMALQDPTTKEEAESVTSDTAGDPHEALPIAKQGLADALKQFPPNHPDVAGSRMDVADACLRLNDVACADTVLRPLDGALDATETSPFVLARLEKLRGTVKVREVGHREEGLRHYRLAIEIARGAEARCPALKATRVEVEALLAKATAR
jgi:tetratricopeptide (TPR) repeat protein